MKTLHEALDTFRVQNAEEGKLVFERIAPNLLGFAKDALQEPAIHAMIDGFSIQLIEALDKAEDLPDDHQRAEMGCNAIENTLFSMLLNGIYIGILMEKSEEVVAC